MKGLIAIALSVLAAIALTGFIGGHAAPITRPNGTSASQAKIMYYDANGHYVKTWTGTQAEKETILTQVDADHHFSGSSYTLKGTTKGTTGTRGHIVPLTYRVSGCSEPETNPPADDFWDLYNSPPLVCFANAGSVAINVYNVYKEESGNNSGYSLLSTGAKFNFNHDDSAVCLNSNGSSCTWYDVVQVTIS